MNEASDPLARECGRLIEEHRLWSSRALVEQSSNLPVLGAHLDRLSEQIGAARQRLVEEKERQVRTGQPQAKPARAPIEQELDEADARRAPARQLEDMVELLTSEDPLSLATVAMIHARVREIIADIDSARTASKPENPKAPNKPSVRSRAEFATSLATFVCQGSTDQSSVNFAMAVIDRTCTLYADLIKDAIDASSTSHG